eukprot:1141674-Pelagomonas_calceolata.AAC.6
MGLSPGGYGQKQRGHICLEVSKAGAGTRVTMALIERTSLSSYTHELDMDSDVIPWAIETGLAVQALQIEGSWRDIGGSIMDFYQARWAPARKLTVDGMAVETGLALKALQRKKLSLHQLRGNGDTLAPKSRESPPPQSFRTRSVNGGLEGYWKHPDPEPVRSVFVFNSTLCGNKVIGRLVVKSQSFKLVKDMLNIVGPTNTQKDVLESHNFCIHKFAEDMLFVRWRLAPLVEPPCACWDLHHQRSCCWGQGSTSQEQESPSHQAHGRQPAKTSIILSFGF